MKGCQFFRIYDGNYLADKHASRLSVGGSNCEVAQVDLFAQVRHGVSLPSVSAPITICNTLVPDLTVSNPMDWIISVVDRIHEQNSEFPSQRRSSKSRRQMSHSKGYRRG